LSTGTNGKTDQSTGAGAPPAAGVDPDR
jgi:hypothetical protein